MGVFSKSERDKAFEALVNEFKDNAIKMVATDKNNKKAVVLIAVEENEKGDGCHVDVTASGTETMLVYAISQFAMHDTSKGIFRKAIGFLKFYSLSNLF